jgi:protein ImuA
VRQALSHLRQDLQRLGPANPPPAAGFTLGQGELDEALGGALPRGCLHEIFEGEAGDAGAAAGFVLALAMRAAAGRKILWIRHDLATLESGGVYAPGLSEFGLDPDAVILVAVRNETMALRAALEALRSCAPGAVILEIRGKAKLLDLTASRRLMLAASRSGGTGFFLRTGEARPSSALTRWRVGAAPSPPLAADAPSHPAFDITLERHRAGIRPRSWRVEWNRDRICFDIPKRDFALLAAGRHATRSAGNPSPALSGAVVSLSFDGQASPKKEKLRRTG